MGFSKKWRECVDGLGFPVLLLGEEEAKSKPVLYAILLEDTSKVV